MTNIPQLIYFLILVKKSYRNENFQAIDQNIARLRGSLHLSSSLLWIGSSKMEN